MVMSKSIYEVYKTTNTVNGKYYIGVHLKNGTKYFGSGVALKRALKKYGRDKFEVIILKEFCSAEDAYEYEKSIVTSDVVADPNSYNLQIGVNMKNTKNRVVE